jgi:signal transduction histidine kinase
MDANEMEKLCRHLDEFALPRAIVNFAQEHFVAWNKTFLARTGYCEEDIRVLKPGDIIVEATSGFVLNNAENDPETEFYAVAIRAANHEAALPGHLVKSEGNLGYLRLEELEPAVSTKFQQGELVGKEQERMRIAQAFHQELSSGLLAAVFKIHLVKERLKAASSPEAQQVAEASEILSETIEKVSEVLREEKPGRPPDSEGE